MPHGPVVVTGATVITMDDERVVERGTVVIDEGRLTAVGPAGEVPIPTDATVIDAVGAFLMPGLCDMHTHLGMRDADPGHLVLYLAEGVTTVRSMSGSPANAEWRDRVAAGDLVGPTIFTAGPTIVGGLEDEDPKLVASLPIYFPQSVDEAVAEVRRQASGWADLVKVYDGLPVDQYLAAISAANEAGIYVAGHALDEAALDTILTSGINEIAHLDELNLFHWIGTPDQAGFALDYEAIADTVALMVENDVAIVSNLVADEVLYQLIFDADDVLSRPQYATVRPERLEEWRREGRHVTRFAEQGPYRRDLEMPFFMTLVRSLHEAGVTITVGTDTSTLEGSVQSNLHRDIELLVEAGLSSFDALGAATRNAAAIAGRMRRDAGFGTVSPGGRADLVLLSANPLDDVGNTRQRIGVMAAGTWYPQDELDERVAEYVATYGDGERAPSP